MLHRAYKICSSWYSFHKEVIRLKQLLTNNNFQFAIIEIEINKFLSKRYVDRPINNNKNVTKLFYRNQMNTQHKQDENNLNKIIDDYTQPTDNKITKLCIYYKNKKLSQLFIKNNLNKKEPTNHVVYQYTCNDDTCQRSYIGYTQTTLKQRLTVHAQTGSILTHNMEKHNNKIRTNDILKSTIILYRSSDKHNLQIAEALFIRDMEPKINNQREGLFQILHVFT